VELMIVATRTTMCQPKHPSIQVIHHHPAHPLQKTQVNREKKMLSDSILLAQKQLQSIHQASEEVEAATG